MSEDCTVGWGNMTTGVTSTYGGGIALQWPSPAPQPMPSGWKCTDCQTVMAPWMASHKCAAVVTTNMPAGTTAGTGILHEIVKGDP